MTPRGHRPRVLELKKSKYDCAVCGDTVILTPYFVAPRANISSVVKAAIGRGILSPYSNGPLEGSTISVNSSSIVSLALGDLTTS
ncbi:hypothetical protein AALM99_00735 [Lactococcus muris]|uniref:Transposase n=1 Tax=Lactococcus muris TaxID=2941330 RepID=A0ABV4D5L0_9LACT|nr:MULTISPECIES: hypothetical protein [Lactococcus]MBL3716247.1 hypothetical protein [Lactococcus garvieae]